MPMNLNTLSLEQVNELLAETTSKGEYERAVNKFFESGELYEDMTALFPGKEETNLTNNVKKYAKLQTIPWQVVKMQNGDGDKQHVLLVNLDAHRLAMQNEEA